MGYTIDPSEQETIVRTGRQESTAIIYTSDKTVITKLDKLYKVTDTDKVDGTVVAKWYECPKRCISFRSDPGFKPAKVEPKRKISPEHIQKMQEARKK